MEKKCSAIQGMQKGMEVNRFVSESDTTSHSQGGLFNLSVEFSEKRHLPLLHTGGGKVIPNVMGLQVFLQTIVGN